MPDNIDFTPFHIFGADGQQYTGVRPSVIPKPFRGAVVVLGGKTFKSGLPPGYSVDQVLGYSAAVRMGLNLNADGVPLRSDKAYRLITLMKDGTKWSRLIYLDGSIEEYWIR